jgi:DNA-binding NarL/FixJ family response regulator
MRDVPSGLIRVVFLEDERGIAELTKEGLASRGIVVIGLAATVEATVALVAADRPDVVVANVELLDELALDLPAALLPAGPPVLWWSGHEGRYRDAAVRAGGAGFVSKRAGLDALVSAIRRTAAGKETWTPDDLRAKRSAPRAPTSRQREVLAGVAAGRPNKEIADELGISERGVESHLRRMYDRYPASNRAELLNLAQRSGWV